MHLKNWRLLQTVLLSVVILPLVYHSRFAENVEMIATIYCPLTNNSKCKGMLCECEFTILNTQPTIVHQTFQREVAVL